MVAVTSSTSDAVGAGEGDRSPWVARSSRTGLTRLARVGSIRCACRELVIDVVVPAFGMRA
jgi:hypothetical protein